MRYRVVVERRDGLADPEGTTTRRALQELGFDVDRVAFGRVIDLEVPDDDPAMAGARVKDMCERLLANPVIERYTVERIE